MKEKKPLQVVRASKGVQVNFDVGDYVHWSRVDQRLAPNTLLAQWVGPFALPEAKEHSYLIRHLVAGANHEVHTSRLKFFADDQLQDAEELLEFVSEQGLRLGVRGIAGHRFNSVRDRWELRVLWVGLLDEETTWEAVADIADQVPALCKCTPRPAPTWTSLSNSASRSAHQNTEGQCHRITPCPQAPILSARALVFVHVSADACPNLGTRLLLVGFAGVFSLLVVPLRA